MGGLCEGGVSRQSVAARVHSLHLPRPHPREHGFWWGGFTYSRRVYYDSLSRHPSQPAAAACEGWRQGQGSFTDRDVVHADTQRADAMCVGRECRSEGVEPRTNVGMSLQGFGVEEFRV